jgi:hypothetical protein
MCPIQFHRLVTLKISARSSKRARCSRNNLEMRISVCQKDSPRPEFRPTPGGRSVKKVSRLSSTPVVMLWGRAVLAVTTPVTCKANGSSAVMFSARRWRESFRAWATICRVIALLLRHEPEVFGVALGIRERVRNKIRVPICMLSLDRRLQRLVPGVTAGFVCLDHQKVRIQSRPDRIVQIRIVEIVTRKEVVALRPYAVDSKSHLGAELALNTQEWPRRRPASSCCPVPGRAGDQRTRSGSTRVRPQWIRVTRIVDPRLDKRGRLLDVARH